MVVDKSAKKPQATFISKLADKCPHEPRGDVGSGLRMFEYGCSITVIADVATPFFNLTASIAAVAAAGFFVTLNSLARFLRARGCQEPCVAMALLLPTK